MDFRFNVKEFLKDDITKIGNKLLPPDFTGDRRTAGEVQHKIAVILDEMGYASAVAQGLQASITSGEKLRNSEHLVYLLTDQESNGSEASLVGLLKVGHKQLYIFDRPGKNYQINPLCILDFYVHESRQRKGYGKILFEYMLNDQNTGAQHLAIDRPSDKFLAFLQKHYHLTNPVPQMNKFVVFDDFFLDRQDWETILIKTKGQNRHSVAFENSPPDLDSDVRLKGGLGSHGSRSSLNSSDGSCDESKVSSGGRYGSHYAPGNRVQHGVAQLLQGSCMNPVTLSPKPHRATGGVASILFGDANSPSAQSSREPSPSRSFPKVLMGDADLLQNGHTQKRVYLQSHEDINSNVANGTVDKTVGHALTPSPVVRDLKFQHHKLW